jgi:glycerophosphoryl diester phosphodiesterase
MKAALAARQHRTGRAIVMDSLSPFIAASLEQHCRCPVGIDAPADRPIDERFIDNAALTGLDWIYADYRQASAELIRYAHGRGLRVLLYTVNNTSDLARLGDELPDAIVTERAGLGGELEQARAAR